MQQFRKPRVDPPAPTKFSFWKEMWREAVLAWRRYDIGVFERSFGAVSPVFGRAKEGCYFEEPIWVLVFISGRQRHSSSAVSKDPSMGMLVSSAVGWHRRFGFPDVCRKHHWRQPTSFGFPDAVPRKNVVVVSM